MRLKAENIGPVRTLDVQVSPGLNVLRGANGSGKSTVLTAVNYALTKSGDKPTPRDGARAGRIEAFGVTVTFTSRATAKGTLEVESLSGRLDLGDLIANQYEDPAVCDKHRIRKLIELSGATADHKQFECLIGLRFSPGDIPTDLIDAADWAKRGLQEKAREHEAQAETYARRRDAALAAVEGVDLTVETDQQRLQESYVQAAADLQTLQTRRTETAQRLKQAADARQQLTAAQSQAVVTPKDAEAAVAFADKTAARRAAEVDEAEKRLVAAREALRAARINQGVAKDRLASAQNHAEAMAAWESLVSAAEKLGPVTDEEIDAARVAADAARRAIESGALARKAKESRAAAEAAADAAKTAQDKAAQLRQAAADTDKILSAELQRIGCSWYPVEMPTGNSTTRRLKTKHARRGETLVAELSDGERAREAIDVALSLSGKSSRPAVLILRQEVFEGLQPAVRAEIDQHAKERGVVILTAAASDDEEVTL